VQDFNEKEFRRTLGRFATGITVITTRGENGRPEGLTANSFNALSLKPPLILWSLSLDAISRPAFLACSHFAVNVLSADQRHLSHRFATRANDKFANLQWSEGLGGVPILDGCIALFECTNAARHDAGDHTVFFGRVERFRRWQGDPLLYYAGNYAHLVAYAEGEGDLTADGGDTDLPL